MVIHEIADQIMNKLKKTKYIYGIKKLRMEFYLDTKMRRSSTAKSI